MSKKGRKLPALRPQKVIRVLLKNGFRKVRTTKHIQLADDEDPPHVVSVPNHKRDLKMRTLRSIIRQAGWTVDEFLDKLK